MEESSSTAGHARLPIEILGITAFDHADPPRCPPFPLYPLRGDCLHLKIRVAPEVNDLEVAQRAVYGLFATGWEKLKFEERPLLLEFVESHHSTANYWACYGFIYATDTLCVACADPGEPFRVRNHVTRSAYSHLELDGTFPDLVEIPQEPLEDLG